MSDTSRENIKLCLFGLLMTVSILCVGYLPEQCDFTHIIIPYLGAFISYYFIVFRIDIENHLMKMIYFSIALRVLLLFNLPNLSDDLYRFIWDGRCLHLGISPFHYLPLEIVGEYEILDQYLFDQLNSPNYFSIYPPVGQIVGYIATLPIFTSWHISSFVFKLFVLGAEIGTVSFAAKLLKDLELPNKNILIYALNPLIIIELVGNIHFEAFMIFFLIASVYFILRNKVLASSLAFTLAICSKLLPLMYVPIFTAILSNRNRIFKYFTTVLFTCFLLFSLFLNVEILTNLIDSVGLYVNKFEFNGSIYYLLREMGYLIKGFNLIHIIGPILSIFTILLISIQAFIFYRIKEIEKHLFTFLLAAFCTYLFLATTVHPWYLATPLLLCIFTSFRFPVLWSGFIFFTYANYAGEVYEEKLWIVLIEYLCVFAFLAYEVKQKDLSLKTITSKFYSGG